MNNLHAIRHVRVTPIAFRDPPLLNAAGIHEPWALRSIIEIETASGLVGINESYGDQPMLDALAKAASALVGLSPWALNDMERRVEALVAPPKITASEFLGQQVSLAPGYFSSRMDILLARDLYPEQRVGDEPEPLEVIPWPLNRIDELLARPDFTESRSISALLLASKWLAEQGN